MIRGTIVRSNDGPVEVLQPKIFIKALPGQHISGTHPVNRKDVYTDLHFTQLKYQLRDRVLCCNTNSNSGDDDPKEWIEHEVVWLWPRPPPDVDHWSVLMSAYPLYICRAVETRIETTIFDDLGETELKDIPSQLRFRVGDIVAFNADKANIKQGAV